MYSNQLGSTEVVLELSEEADERTIAWLKRDLERRRAERARSQGELVAS